MAQSREYLFEQEKISKAVFSLSIPTICSNLVMILYSLADTFFVGLINSPAQTAAVSLASPILLAFNAVNNLFGVGASSMMSRALGAKDYKTLKQSSSFGFYGALFSGIVLSVIIACVLTPLCHMLGANAETLEPTRQYLIYAVILGAPFSILNVVLAYMVRSEGNTLHAAIGTMSGCLINIVLDPIFILGFGMQAAGAALATLLSNVCAVIYFLVYLYIRRHKTMICISIKEFTLRRQIVGGVCNVGIPASIQNLLNVASQILINFLASGYGTVAVAAIGISFRASQVMLYVAMGISQGVMPLVGYTYAAGMIKRMKECIFFTLKISCLILLTLTIFYEIFPREIIDVFIANEETVSIGSVLIRGMALANPFLALDFMAVGVFQACGKGMLSLIMALLRKLAFEIPFMLLFNAVFGLYGLGFSAFAAEFLMAIIGMFLLFRLLKQTEKKTA